MNYQAKEPPLDQQMLEAIERLNGIFLDLANRQWSNLPPTEKIGLLQIVSEMWIIFDTSFEEDFRKKAKLRLIRTLANQLSIPPAFS